MAKKSKITLNQLVKLIEKEPVLDGLFVYNLFSKNIEFTRPAIWGNDSSFVVDNDLIEFKNYLEEVHKNETDMKTIEEALVVVARKRKYHPIKRYLESLIWDGVARIDRWLIELCGCEENIYVKDVSKKFICAAIRRIYEPGCKFDYMMIMEGGQGIGKTTFFNTLGGEWYLDTQLNTSESKKDIIDIMRTAWIIEIADLAGFRKHEHDSLRAFVSRRIDRVRLSYARRSDDFPRQCVFVGTHNPSGDNEYLKDDTGNRRYWPVVANKIDLVKTKEWRDQLWAEAMVKYKDEILFIDNKESLDILNNVHKDREPATPYEQIIEDYAIARDRINNKEIIEHVFNKKINDLSYSELRSRQTIIGVWMKKNHWIKGQNDKRGWYFRDEQTKFSTQVDWAE